MLIPDFDPESETFSIQDTEESVIVVISKEQLEEAIKLYVKCYGFERLRDIIKIGDKNG